MFHNDNNTANDECTVTTQIKSSTSVPTVTGTTICSGSTASLTATGSLESPGFKWYNVATGGKALYTGNSFTTPALITTTTYYVSTYDLSSHACESNRIPVTVMVLAIPTLAAVTQSAPSCGGSLTINLTGLAPGSINNITFNIGGVSQTPVSVTANASGNGSFNTPGLASVNGKILSITGITNDNTSCSSSFESKNITLIANSLPSITGQPTSATLCSGQTQTFSVTAIGSSLTYQWRKAGVNISEARSSHYSIESVTADDAGIYDVLVRGICDSSVTSSSVILTVKNPPAIQEHSASATLCSGQTQTFSVTATGTSLTYQWRKAGVNISEATSSNYKIASVKTADAGIYDVVVRGTCTPSVTSSSVTLTVNRLPEITGQPASAILCSGQTQTFSVTANGPSLTYQWRKAGVNISGATSSTYNIGSVTTDDAGSYDVVINGTCASVTSSPVTLTVNTLPAITSQPSSESKCTGQSKTFSVTATGTSITYQWRREGVNISGATSSTYNIASVTTDDAGSYDVVINGTCATSVTSSLVTLTVNTLPAITSQPSSESKCTGQSKAFSVTATGTSITYQWRKAGVNISGATSSTYNIGSVTTDDAGSYDVVINGTCATSVTSSPVTLIVNTLPAITSQPSSESKCTGQSKTFSVTATGTSITYQWRREGANIPGATSSTFDIASVTTDDAGSYDVVVSGTCASTVTSSSC